MDEQSGETEEEEMIWWRHRWVRNRETGTGMRLMKR